MNMIQTCIDKIFIHIRDSSDFQFSIPNSPKVIGLSPKYKSVS